MFTNCGYVSLGRLQRFPPTAVNRRTGCVELWLQSIRRTRPNLINSSSVRPAMPSSVRIAPPLFFVVLFRQDTQGFSVPVVCRPCFPCHQFRPASWIESWKLSSLGRSRVTCPRPVCDGRNAAVGSFLRWPSALHWTTLTWT